IRGAGLTNPIAVIPNGIELQQEMQELPETESYRRIVLSLGRIHPKKGLPQLLHSWAAVESDHPDWSLRIIGPSEAGHADELHSIALALGLARVEIRGAVFDEAKWRAYRAADVCVMPTLNENFGLTVAEALAAGTPVITTKGAPWSRL